MKTIATWLVFGAVTLLGTTPWAAARAEDAPAAGVWQKHEYRFSFVGFTTTYSCDGLADKLKVLLLAAGARPDVKSQAAACARGFGRPDKFASAYLTFYTLATPGADQLSDAPAVRGNWRTVTFTPRKPYQLGLGDCELIEQFRDHVLPLFAVRNVDDKTTCVPHQVSGSGYRLSFDAFAALDSPSADRKGT
jgi:hypothetical protein